MKEKIQKIINQAIEENEILESKIEKLRNKIDFCQDHKFQEETRIARIELNAIEIPSYKHGRIIKELQHILNTSCS